MRVFVYFNLHKGCWSIKALEGANAGRVIGHTDSALLERCTFKVSEAGRQRVIREKRKNVHAGIVGTLTAWQAISGDVGHDGLRVSYNPYERGEFTERETCKRVAVKRAERVAMLGRTVYAMGAA